MKIQTYCAPSPGNRYLLLGFGELKVPPETGGLVSPQRLNHLLLANILLPQNNRDPSHQYKYDLVLD